MNHAEQARALERAAAPALAAIEEDELRAPEWLRPLYRAMRELLFDSDLDLDQIQEAAGFADVAVWNDLREEAGQPSWSYLRDARLETAAHLLLETEMSISEVGYLVGYGSASSFRQLMRSFLDMPPSQYRRKAKRRLGRAGPAPAGSDTNDYWERMLAGELSDDEGVAQSESTLGRVVDPNAFTLERGNQVRPRRPERGDETEENRSRKRDEKSEGHDRRVELISELDGDR